MALYPVSPPESPRLRWLLLSHCHPVFNVYTYVEILVSLGYSVACRASVQRKARVLATLVSHIGRGSWGWHAQAAGKIMTGLRRGTCCRQSDHIKLVTGSRAIFASPSINVTLTRGVGQGVWSVISMHGKWAESW
jgi:hypothetical protein